MILNMNEVYHILIIISFNFILNVIKGSVINNEIRGLNPANLEKYLKKDVFTCLDGLKNIPLNYINDDYCDCLDSSDEPGTSACPSGRFFCLNKGYKSVIIPSSRVSDGICDCCDGSDEYSGFVNCNNNCEAMGQELRAQQDKDNKLRQQGYQLYLQYTMEGKQAKDDKRVRILELKNERETLEVKKFELQDIVYKVEAPEKEAKEKHEKAWEEVKNKLKKEKSEASARKAFDQLDSDNDGFVEVEELQQHSEFDIDKNGEVSTEEAKEHLEDHDRLEFIEFHSKVWENIEPLYNPHKKVEAEAITSDDDDKKLTEPPITDVDTNADDDEEEIDGDDDGVEKDKEIVKKDEEEMMSYDEETQNLIKIADEARKNYNDVDSKLKDLDRENSELIQLIEADDGPDDEFQPLRGKCFEFDSREYTYILCPFDRASQKSKSNSQETSLGSWGKWVDENGSPHGAMMYDRGQNCWNGPDRSAKVILECGLTNEMLSVSEPSRCEYLFTFSTPASCSRVTPPSTTTPDETHSEL